MAGGPQPRAQQPPRFLHALRRALRPKAIRQSSGSSEVLHAAGLQMLLGDTEYTLSREESLIETLLQRRPEAVIITGGNHTARARKMLAEAHIPLV